MNSLLVLVQVSLLIGPVSLNIESKFSSWQSHLDLTSWGEEKINLTSCLGSCMCAGDEADCSSQELSTFPSFIDKTIIIKTL